MIRSVLFAIALLLTTITPLTAASAGRPYDGIVKQFFPIDIADGRNLNGGKPGKLHSAYVVTTFAPGSLQDSESDGAGGRTKYIVAAYTNGWEVNFRLLSNKGSQWNLVREWHNGESVTGPDLSLRDVDGDGIPEVVASFREGPHANNLYFLFKWNGQDLTCMTPMCEGSNASEIGSDLYVVAFADLYGDGKLGIIASTGEKVRSTNPGGLSFREHYQTDRLVNGRYVRDKALAFYGEMLFLPANKASHTKTFEFAIDHPQGDWVLRIVKTDGKRSIRDAEVTLNGALVAGPVDFRRKDRVLLIPVGLQANNVLSFTIDEIGNGDGGDASSSNPGDSRGSDGKGSEFFVAIEPK